MTKQKVRRLLFHAALVTVAALALVVVVSAFAGCNTIYGAGDFAQGIGTDLKWMSQKYVGEPNGR
jgi:predicted small secreted protein